MPVGASGDRVTNLENVTLVPQKRGCCFVLCVLCSMLECMCTSNTQHNTTQHNTTTRGEHNMAISNPEDHYDNIGSQPLLDGDGELYDSNSVGAELIASAQASDPAGIQGTPELAKAIREAPIAASALYDGPGPSPDPAAAAVEFDRVNPQLPPAQAATTPVVAAVAELATDPQMVVQQRERLRQIAEDDQSDAPALLEKLAAVPCDPGPISDEQTEQEVLSARLAVERTTAAPAQNVCLTPGCGGKIRSRGLCQNCYSAARLRVNSEVSTWEDLENSGLALPSKKKGSVESSAAFEAAFKAAQERQAAEACVHAEAEKAHAAIAAPGPERTVESFSTQDDIRNAALAVSNNPCQQNLDILASVQARLRPLESPELSPVGRTYVSTPQEEPNPHLHNPQPPAAYPPQDLHQTPVPVAGIDPANPPQLSDGMVWEQGPSGMVARAKTEEEFLIEERKAGQQKSRKLRLQSREDCRIDKDHEVLEDQGDLDNTGMSDEEFDRIKTAHGIRTGTIAPPPPRVQKISERRKPAPQFAEPPLPIPENTPCDPTLG